MEEAGHKTNNLKSLKVVWNVDSSLLWCHICIFNNRATSMKTVESRLNPKKCSSDPQESTESSNEITETNRKHKTENKMADLGSNIKNYLK